MKKRMAFLAMLVCLLAFGLVFIGCKSDGGGGGLSLKDLDLADLGFTADALSSIYGGDIPPSPSNEDEAYDASVPIFDVLKVRYKSLEDIITAFVEDYMTDLESDVLYGGPSSVNKTFDISEIITADLSAAGIKDLAGNVNISASINTKTGGYTVNVTVNLTHVYDSAYDLSGSYSGNMLYANIKVTAKDNETEVYGTSWTEVKSSSMSYAIAYAGTDYCGLATSNCSYKTTETNKAGSYNVNSAGGTFKFYDLNNKQTFSYSLPKEDAIDLFDL